MSTRLERVTLAAALGAGLLWAVPAQAAGVSVQGVPGASCRTDKRTNAPWEYRGRRLLNTSTNPYEIVIAVCPVTLFAPGVQALEYRIILGDSERRDTWCQVYRSNGTLYSTQWAAGGGVTTFYGSLGSPLPGNAGLVELTFHCLVQSGASFERIEIVWYQP